MINRIKLFDPLDQNAHLESINLDTSFKDRVLVEVSDDEKTFEISKHGQVINLSMADLSELISDLTLLRSIRENE